MSHYLDCIVYQGNITYLNYTVSAAPRDIFLLQQQVFHHVLVRR